jgi:hypothetical protein
MDSAQIPDHGGNSRAEHAHDGLIFPYMPTRIIDQASGTP